MIGRISLVLMLGFSALAQPVIETSRSPHAKLHGFPIRSVKLGDGFWAERRAVNVKSSMPTLLQLFEEKGIIDNFRRLSGRKDVPRRGPLYTDSDIYKWLEAVAFVLQSEEQPELKAQAEKVIDDIVAAQEPSGYLNTYYQDERKDKRFTEMQRGHELYCLGHLLQAGIAWQRGTGDRKLLEAGIRFVNYLVENFGPGKRPLLAGHPEIELALAELYRTTGDKRYLALAGYILQGDDRLNLAPRELTYMFSGKPFASRTHFEGHSVRAVYAASGATDYYMETGDESYRKTLDILWRDMTSSKMYITGGVGSRAAGEAFGEPYELPNQLAYTESCAAIANVFWNWRMLMTTGEARYMDLFERALYNGANSGLSISGNLYCYRNPLAMSGNPDDKIRNPWYDTTCCPPNIQRLLASLPGYMYSESPEGVYVNLYHSSDLDWKGTGIVQKTRYPWDGVVEITINPPSPKAFTLFVRIADWSTKTKVSVPGGVEPQADPGTYLPIRRTWSKGDTVRVTFDMTPRMVAANPRVQDDIGKAAVMRGPLVYCLEELDQGQTALADVALSSFNDFRPEWKGGLLGGVTVLKHLGSVSVKPSAGQRLYQPLSKRATRRADLELIPYYTFANREPTPMAVWMPYE